jgi:hypothetical protein
MQPAWGGRGPDARSHVVLSQEDSGERCQIQERMGTPAPTRKQLIEKHQKLRRTAQVRQRDPHYMW